MRILLDTNILVRLANGQDPGRTPVLNTLRQQVLQGSQLFLVPQNLYEFWAVATRPQQVNGLGITPDQARQEIERFTLAYEVLPETSAVFQHWLNLVSTHAVSGRPSHDARIAAAVQAHGLDALLTLNAPHFKRFDLTVLTPADL